MMPLPPRSTLCPYTTLFRSVEEHEPLEPPPRPGPRITHVDGRWPLGPLGRATREGGGSPLSVRSEEHTSELQSRQYLVCRLLLEKKTKLQSRQYLVCRLLLE